MKNYILKRVLVVLLIVPMLSVAQEFQGQAYYQSKSKVEMKMEGDKVDDAQMKKINDMLKKQFEKSFVLNFNREESVYDQEQELDKPAGQVAVKMIFVGGPSGDATFYKNTKEKTYTREQSLFGKEFLISDELEKFDWKLEKESKMIGNYLCFKATSTREIEVVNHVSVQVNDDAKKDVKKEKRKQVITAWYTTDIPVNHGPDKYWGLPGLIMELNVDKTQYLCTKIVMNPKDKHEIKAPTKGKKVTQEKYNEIMKKKLEEMNENQGRQSKDSKSFSFTIGG